MIRGLIGRYRIYFVAFVLLMGSISRSYAQYDNVWAFGWYAGIDFSTDPPTAIETKIFTDEGSASVCDRNGQLLFYTDGNSVWDRNQDQMPSGTDLPGLGQNITSSTAQAAVIVPMPGSQSKYYIFSLGPQPHGLYFSVVDMSLNAGLGDVSQKGILLDSLLNEHMAAVSGNNCDVWLVVRSRLDNNFKVFNIGYGGISRTPVTSKAAPEAASPYGVSPHIVGCIDIAPNRRKLAMSGEKVRLFDFDPGTGKIDNMEILDSNTSYGICFSPDNSKLYVSEINNQLEAILCQFNLDAGSLVAVKNSKEIIYKQSRLLGTVMRAHTGKIYIGVDGNLGVINRPDLLGAACDFVEKGVILLPGTGSGLGLSNLVPISNPDIITVTRDSGLCAADTILMQAVHLDGSHYVWNDDSVGQYKRVNQSGSYWVSYEVESVCTLHHTDSFLISYPDIPYAVSFLSDTLSCAGDIIHFENSSDMHFKSFSWSLGDGACSGLENPQYRYEQPGRYVVRLIGMMDSVCADTAYRTIVVDAPVVPDFFLVPDSICTGEAIAFSHEMNSPAINGMYWQFGDGLEIASKAIRMEHAYDMPGVLPVILKVDARACRDTSVRHWVYVEAPPRVTLGPDTALCLNNKPLFLRSLEARQNAEYSYRWSTGDTTGTLKVTHPGLYRLTVSSNLLHCNNSAEINIAKDCYLDIPNVFTPNGDGINDYFFPRQLLSESLSEFKMQIFNRWGQLRFETTNINGRGWDGRFNGSEQPKGVYLYLIDGEIDGIQTEHYQGNVTLIR